MAASTRSRAKDAFKGVLREEISEMNDANTASLNESNYLNTRDVQELKDENERAHADLMQTLDLEVYRVAANAKSSEFDPCAQTVFETALAELRTKNEQKKI